MPRTRSPRSDLCVTRRDLLISCARDGPLGTKNYVVRVATEARALGHEGSRSPLGYVYRYDQGITCCAAKASTYSTNGRLYQRPSNEGVGGAGVGSSRSRKARYTRAPMPTINSM